MNTWRYLTTALALIGLIFCLGGCCGDSSGDDDDFNPIPHNEGTGGDA